MGNGKTATAAPKKRARARIKVVRDDNQEPLRNAMVEITSQRKSTTNAKGIYETTFFLEGTYDLKVFAAGFCPPAMNPRREFTHIKSETFPAVTQKKPFTEITVPLAQALPRAKVKVVDPSRGKAGIHGIEVEVTGQNMGRTDASGLYFSPPFNIGKFDVKTRKPGYGPPPSGPEGPVEKLHDFDKAEDKAIDVEMVLTWGRVKSSNITVAGKNFVDWFNDDFRKRMPAKFPKNPTKDSFPGRISKPGFNNVFDNCAKLWAPELSVEEFVGICMIIYNETGGGFRPVSEVGTPQYMFEAKKGVKVSYNAGGNRKAGDLLKARGQIKTDEEVAQWNGQVWPNPPEGSDLHKAALECDFFKFRGRGLIQITFRSAYLKHVDPSLVAAGQKKSDDLTEAELGNIILTNIDVFLPMVKSFLNGVRASYEGVNRYDWREFGLSIAGRFATAYADLFEFRCQNLFDEMRKDKFVLK